MSMSMSMRGESREETGNCNGKRITRKTKLLFYFFSGGITFFNEGMCEGLFFSIVRENRLLLDCYFFYGGKAFKNFCFYFVR